MPKAAFAALALGVFARAGIRASESRHLRKNQRPSFAAGKFRSLSRKSATDIGIRPLSAGTDPSSIGLSLPFGIPQRSVLQIELQSWHTSAP
jgi:hypothetical protein